MKDAPTKAPSSIAPPQGKVQKVLLRRGKQGRKISALRAYNARSFTVTIDFPAETGLDQVVMPYDKRKNGRGHVCKTPWKQVQFDRVQLSNSDFSPECPEKFEAEVTIEPARGVETIPQPQNDEMVVVSSREAIVLFDRHVYPTV